MTRIEQLESLDLDGLPKTVEGLQQVYGGTVRELISAYRHIDYLNNRIYGKKSERFVHENQLAINFRNTQEETTSNQDPATEQTPIPETELITYERKIRRGRKFENLPAIEEHSYPEAEERCCSCCGEQKREVMTEEVTQLHYEPCKLCKKKTIKHIFKCESGCEPGLTSPKPAPHIIDKCLATPELLAHVLTSKFVDHIPLHRTGKIFQRYDVVIPDTTLIGWVNQFGAAIRIIISCIRDYILLSDVIGTDDTPIRVLQCESDKDPKKDWNGSITGRFWQYQSLDGRIVFEYTPDRSANGPSSFLQGYKGYLQADDYAGYNDAYRQGAIQVGCWAHARRKFFELAEKHKYRDEALRLIGVLYLVERLIKTQKKQHALQNQFFSDEQVVALRQEQALPAFNNFKSWLQDASSSSLPKSDFAQAANYVLSNEQALTRYLCVGFLSIDNNWVERKIRPIAIGKKNWLFCGNNQTAQNAARIISLAANCTSAQVNPYNYFVYLIKTYSTVSGQEVYRLTPWGYRDFLNSKNITAPP